MEGGQTKNLTSVAFPGLQIHIVEFDVRDAPAISKIVADIESKTPIDLLVNNAGRHLICPAELAKIEDAMTVYDINVMGPLRMCQAVLPYMRKRRAGRIVNITSGGSFVAVPHMAMCELEGRAGGWFERDF